MTLDELKEAHDKYLKYLQASGVRVLSSMIYFDNNGKGELLGSGNPEMCATAMLLIVADTLGLTVVPK